MGEDAEKIAERLIAMTQLDLVKVVAKGEEIIGFMLGFPDLSAALQRCKGRLYPFGWALLLWEFKRTRWINFNGGGILPKYQGLGVNAVLYSVLENLGSGVQAQACLWRNSAASGLVKADWRPHSSEFSHLLIL